MPNQYEDKELRDIVNLRVNAELSEQDISNLVHLITQKQLALLDELDKDMNSHEITMQGNRMLYRANIEQFVLTKRQTLQEDSV